MMDTKVFQKTVHKALLTGGLKKQGSSYVADFEDLLIVVGLQRSSYSAGYYIEVGYMPKVLHPVLDKPKYYQASVRSRFDLDEGSFYDLDLHTDADAETLATQISVNVEKYVAPIKSVDDLKKLVERNPVMLFQTFDSAKTLMGFS